MTEITADVTILATEITADVVTPSTDITADVTTSSTTITADVTTPSTDITADVTITPTIITADVAIGMRGEPGDDVDLTEHEAAHPIPTIRDDRNQVAGSYADALTEDENYVTDAELVVVQATSGTNTGDNPGVTSVTGTTPVVSSGGDTPAISIPAATNSNAGYATAAHIQAIEANTSKDGTSHADVLVDGDINVTVAAIGHNHSGTYEPADATIIKQDDVDDIAVNGVTTFPISSNWAFDHAADAAAHGTYNNYVHPNHSGDVTSVADGAQTIATAAVTNAKMADMVQSTIKGRVTASTGVPEDLTATQVRTLINVADGADVTSTNETSHSDVLVDGDIGVNVVPQSHVTTHPVPTTRDTRNQVVLGSDDNYVTDAELVVIQATSNTNTGDQTKSDIDALDIDADTVDGIQGSAITALIDSLTGDVMADSEHRHSELSASDGTPNPAVSVDADGNTTVVGQLGITGASKIHVTRTTAQSIPSLTLTRVNFNTEVFDNLGEFDNVTNYRFTATKAGAYYITSGLFSDNVAWPLVTSYWEIGIYKNGTLVANGKREFVKLVNALRLQSDVNAIIELAVNDYIEIKVIHTHGSAVNCIANGAFNYLMIHRLS